MKKRKKEKNFIFQKSVIISLVGIAVCLGIFFSALLGAKDYRKVSSTDFSSEMEKRISRMVSSHPIRIMIPEISKQDRMVAAFLVAIAKKESNWGRYSPKKEGRDCYNYWGYRGTYNQTDSGYSCFDSPGQAIEEVGGRISDLIQKGVNSPKEMVSAWKCGWDCSGHSFWSVKKWEWDVKYYFDKIYN